MGGDRAIRGNRVVLPGGVRPATIHIRDGAIHAIDDGAEADDYGDLVIMPGLVDTHVHINEPGRTEWEGFARATRSAAAGGVTTLIEMPLNAIPPTTTVPNFELKLAAARDQCWVDVGFWGGVIPGNAEHIPALLQAGVWGFKCFLTPSGVDEFPNVTEADLREAMPVLARTNALLLAHAELPSALRAPVGDPRSHATWEASRPTTAEDAAIALLIRLSRAYRCRVHIVHLASPDSLAQLAGTNLTVETCPHYLNFASEESPDGATRYKCAPPIRPAAVRERLWDGLRSGAIGMIVSDHSPCPPPMKQGDFLTAWGGIASLGCSLSAVWTAASRRGFGIADLARWMCAAPAAIAGLDHRKGALAPGMDADLVIWDPDQPCPDPKLRGVVRETWLAGQPVDCGARPRGRILKRPASLATLTEEDLLECCGSRTWAGRMRAAGPYASVVALEQAADCIWNECSPEDWREAFTAHPRIGQTYSHRSREEQSGVAGAPPGILADLAELNQRYQEKFGYIYIVCASGKTAAEMLAILKRRLANDPAHEILEAAGQERQIARLRLRKLLSPPTS
jgi:allantoinase